MKKIEETTAPELTPAELREWRTGYRHYLEAKGLPPSDAAKLASMVAYRPDLYPAPGAVPDLFRLEPPVAAPVARKVVAKTKTLASVTTPPAKTTAAKATKLPAIIEGKPSATPPTKREHALITASAEIMGQSPTGDDFAFIHSVMCQVGLPRAKVEGERFMRQSGAAWLNVQAGFLDEGHGPVLQPVPYGAMPRLALAWVSTYAKRHGSREIPIGDSAAEFLRLMGLDDQGARYVTLRKQMHALAACRLQLGYKGRTFNGQPVDQFDAWVANRETGQRALWPGVMVLSENYFTELVENAVPLDNRALFALKGSALALDVYAWLAHRLHRIDGRPVILHWTNMREQFGQEYQGKDADKDFKKKFLIALRAVHAVYPQAKVKKVTGGLMLMASPPPIPYKGQ